MKGLTALIKNNLILEYRSWTQGFGILILVWIFSFIGFRLKPDLSTSELNLFFWLFIMLIAVNAAMRQDGYHSEEEKLTLYTLVDPVTLICARIAYNFIYLLILGICFYFFLIIYFPSAYPFSMAVMGVIALGALAMSACLSLVTAIGAQGGGQNTLVSILGFPLLIPVVILLNNLSNSIILSGSMPGSSYLLIVGIGGAGMALSLVLFPFIWKQ